MCPLPVVRQRKPIVKINIFMTNNCLAEQSANQLEKNLATNRIFDVSSRTSPQAYRLLMRRIRVSTLAGCTSTWDTFACTMSSAQSPET